MELAAVQAPRLMGMCGSGMPRFFPLLPVGATRAGFQGTSKGERAGGFPEGEASEASEASEAFEACESFEST